MAWTDELKAKAVKMYKDGNPTPANSTELCKDIAEELGEEFTANGVRMILMKADVYVKKEATASTDTKTGGTTKKEGAKRVSKEDSINALKEAIEAKGKTVDAEILDKLTGKAAVYLLEVISE